MAESMWRSDATTPASWLRRGSSTDDVRPLRKDVGGTEGVGSLKPAAWQTSASMLAARTRIRALFTGRELRWRASIAQELVLRLLETTHLKSKSIVITSPQWLAAVVASTGSHPAHREWTAMLVEPQPRLSVSRSKSTFLPP